MTSTSREVTPETPAALRSRPGTWIIVCEHFHGAVGVVPTEQLAVELAAYASEIGACTYRAVPLELTKGRLVGRTDDEAIRSTV